MIRRAIEKLIENDPDAPFTGREAEEVARKIMAGEAAPSQIGAFLALLRARGERVEHLVGFVRAMRDHAVEFPRPAGLTRVMDTCGTGGDMAGTFNISTASALIVAAAGVTVAKHGNRSVSSACGSADVLTALGVNVAPEPEVSARALRETGFCFLFAPRYHPAMKHAAQPRREIGIRTLFNLSGPLSNPARPTHQVIGVPRPELLTLVAEALAALGITRALIVHGSDGLDEITHSTVTTAIEIHPDGRLEHHLINPADFGIKPSNTADLAGGAAAENARILAHEALAGRPGPRLAATLLNAGAALWIAGEALTLGDGVALARETVASGRPLEILAALRRLTPAPPAA